MGTGLNVASEIDIVANCQDGRWGQIGRNGNDRLGRVVSPCALNLSAEKNPALGGNPAWRHLFHDLLLLRQRIAQLAIHFPGRLLPRLYAFGQFIDRVSHFHVGWVSLQSLEAVVVFAKLS